MLQQVVIQRIVRISRLRLLYGGHLALFGLALVVGALGSTDPTRLASAALLLMTWLPVLLLHTAVQAYYELRERCVLLEPEPALPFERALLPVAIYDEDGKLVSVTSSDPLLPG